MNFQTQADNFIKAIQVRKRNPVKPATVVKYQKNLAYATPLLGNRDLADVNNSALKVLIEKLSKDGLSASTITGVSVVVKLVVASAVDGEGNELYPRTWNNEFIELPVIVPSAQHAPVASAKAISGAISKAFGRDKALIALLAGTGIRIGEALALTSNDWDRVNLTMSISKTLSEGQTGSPKTDAGNRLVDLTPELNNFLIQYIGTVQGQLFPMNAMTAWRHMEGVGIHDGAHTLRRFRVTQLRAALVPESLIKFWTGHSNESVTDRYDKIREDVNIRRQYTQKVGLGFQLGA